LTLTDSRTRFVSSNQRLAEPLLLLFLTATALALSAFHPYDRTTWWLEVFPVLLGVPILVATHGRFRLTPILYRLLFAHALILILGSHYTYERVPLGDMARDFFGLDRNPYDRVGHFAQGFVPAILARELLLCLSPLRPGKWLFFLVCSVCLAVSATYELVEWIAALCFGESAEAFLGTQGDPWDTQWDMFLALLGALLAQTLLSGTHDRAITRLHAGPSFPRKRESSPMDGGRAQSERD